MKNSKISYVTVLIAVLWVFGVSETVKACDCKGVGGKAALLNADVAFSGKVTKIEYLDDSKQRRPEPRIVVTFEVYRVWKGKPKRKMVLHTIFNGFSCGGYWFYEGKEYLVFAKSNDTNIANLYPKSKQSLGVGICNGTTQLADAKKDVIELGKGKAPK